MTSKNDHEINDLLETFSAQDLHINELYTRTRKHEDRLAALENARNQAAIDPDELGRLRTANEQLVQQNGELTAANRRIAELSTKRWKDILDLRAENERLRELLEVTDQHAGEIVRALAVAEDETREMGK